MNRKTKSSNRALLAGTALNPGSKDVLRSPRPKSSVEMKQLQELLVEKEELVEAQAQLIMVLDHERRILTTNRFGANVLGYAKALLLGRRFTEFIGGNEKWKIEKVFTQALSGKPVHNFEGKLVKKNGRSIFVSLDLIPLRPFSGGNNVDRLVATAREITAQKKLVQQLTSAKKEADELYEELREAYRELKETQDELVRQEKLAATGELAAAVAHEIRNPLSIINMSVQYIHGKLGPEDPLREFTEAIIEKVTRVDHITKELINYGRPRELVLRTVDVQRAIDSVLRLVVARARSQRVEIHRNFSRYLPLVKMDVERMDEVFSNLFTNALDAMPEGGHLTVAIREDPDGNRVVVEIANTGKGISPRKRAQLFTPFFTTKPDGTGLGLAICQRIVGEHHGSISVESKISGPNKGTNFIVTLPIASPEKEPSPVKTVDEALLTQKAI